MKPRPIAKTAANPSGNPALTRGGSLSSRYYERYNAQKGQSLASRLWHGTRQEYRTRGGLRVPERDIQTGGIKQGIKKALGGFGDALAGSFMKYHRHQFGHGTAPLSQLQLASYQMFGSQISEDGGATGGAVNSAGTGGFSDAAPGETADNKNPGPVAGYNIPFSKKLKDRLQNEPEPESEKDEQLGEARRHAKPRAVKPPPAHKAKRNAGIVEAKILKSLRPRTPKQESWRFVSTAPLRNTGAAATPSTVQVSMAGGGT